MDILNKWALTVILQLMLQNEAFEIKWMMSASLNHSLRLIVFYFLGQAIYLIYSQTCFFDCIIIPYCMNQHSEAEDSHSYIEIDFTYVLYSDVCLFIHFPVDLTCIYFMSFLAIKNYYLQKLCLAFFEKIICSFIFLGKFKQQIYVLEHGQHVKIT